MIRIIEFGLLDVLFCLFFKLIFFFVFIIRCYICLGFNFVFVFAFYLPIPISLDSLYICHVQSSWPKSFFFLITFVLPI